MTCEEARKALLTLDPAELRDLSHLETCAECRSLAEALAQRQSDLDRALSSFAEARPVPHADSVQPANRPWRWRMSIQTVLLTAAAAATLTLGVRTAWVPGPTTSGSEPCAITEALEKSAIEGVLSDEEVACLTDKGDGSSKANRLLIVNAWAHGDMEAWRAHVDREMARSRAAGDVDPDLAYALALRCSKAQDWDCVVQAVEDTLAHMDIWEDELRENRTRSLLKIRARAGEALAAESDDPALEEQAAEWLRDFEALNAPE